jgi:hypothetical protein
VNHRKILFFSSVNFVNFFYQPSTVNHSPSTVNRLLSPVCAAFLLGFTAGVVAAVTVLILASGSI